MDDIVECVAHAIDYDPECEYCVAEVQAIDARTAKVNKGNKAAEQRLAYLGHTIEMAGVVALRTNTLVDFLFNHNPKMRAKFEALFAANCGQALQLTEQAANRARLITP